MDAYVYILKSKSGTFYIASTDNLARRLKQHAYGHTQTTKNHKINQLVFQQKFGSLLEARQAERKLKSWKRKDYLEKIVKDGYIKSTKPLSFNG